MARRDDNLVLYDYIIAQCPDFERKGKTMPYTSANGYMFSQLNKEGEVGVRLPKARGKQFMEDFNTTSFLSYGAVMRDYVLIPDEMLQDTQAMMALMKEAFDHVMSLPPK